MNDILNLIFMNISAVARKLDPGCFSNSRHQISVEGGSISLTLQGDRPTISLKGMAIDYLPQILARMTSIEIESADKKDDLVFIAQKIEQTTITDNQTTSFSFNMVKLPKTSALLAKG